MITDDYFLILSIVFYINNYSKDLYVLYKVLGEDNLRKLISVFNGKLIRIPKIETFKEMNKIAFIYYNKIIKNMSWKDIKEIYKNIDKNDILYPDNYKKILDKITRHIKKELSDTILKGEN